MKILHICSYYNTSSLYKHLFKSISNIDNKMEQKIYIPMAIDASLCPEDHGTVRCKTDDYDRVEHIYKEVFNKNDRFIFSLKNLKMYKGLLNSVDIQNIDFIHAHSLFANGNIAYKIKKEKNIDYIVAVRATDVEVFLRKMVHLRKLGIKIMKESKNIIFISHNLKKEVINKYVPEKYRKEIEEKSLVIPNGIDSFWYSNKNELNNIKKDNTDLLKLIYIGTLHKRKNVDKIIDVFESLNNHNIPTRLEIVGGGPDKSKIDSKIEKSQYCEMCTINTWTNNREELLLKYKNSDIFIMPSVKETFGISYLEALSQGKPIIYTKNDGVDGYFKDGEVGYSVDPNNIEYIVECIKNIVDDYDDISERCIQNSRKFSWDKIAEKYINIYE
ncbi:glycosyltransferase family 4 protein [Paraclostridium tenue]|uniref:Glycosyltransferase family 4 protein n=1 Tax=Paraclostridium tenue TaxID=1737 RepID=A0ABN1LX07_9FIRM